MMITSVYYSCYTYEGEEIDRTIDEVGSKRITQNIQIVEVDLDEDEEEEVEGEDAIDNEEDEMKDVSTIEKSERSPTIPVLETIMEASEPSETLKVIPVINMSRNFDNPVKDEKEDCIFKNKRKDCDEKCKKIYRSDRLYLLGKQSISKRRERHYDQIAEEKKRTLRFEQSLEKKRSMNRSMNSTSGNRRAIRLYELSRPKQMEGELRRLQLMERSREKIKSQCYENTTCSITTSDSSTSSSSFDCLRDSPLYTE